MILLIAVSILALSCLAITYRTLMSYGHFSVKAKVTVFLLLSLAWFSPFLLRVFRLFNWVNDSAYAITSKATYFMMGFAFILFMLLVIRDIIWSIVYYTSRKESLNPMNEKLLNKCNIITIFVALLVSFYAVFEANKTPAVKEVSITDSRIKENTKLTVVSDLHIDRATPLWQIRNIVEKTNATKPDYILLTGDIIDDTPDNLEAQMKELEKLKAKTVFLTLGNHEYYNEPIKWMIKFT